MNDDKEKLITKLFCLITHLEDFRYDDVDILLRTPFKKDRDYLMSLVSLTDDEAKIIELVYFKDMSISKASKLFNYKSEKNEFDTICTRTLSEYIKNAKTKMFQVWSHDKIAIIHLQYAKMYEIKPMIKKIIPFLK